MTLGWATFFLDVTDIAQMIKEENRQTEFQQYFILLLLFFCSHTAQHAES